MLSFRHLTRCAAFITTVALNLLATLPVQAFTNAKPKEYRSHYVGSYTVDTEFDYGSGYAAIKMNINGTDYYAGGQYFDGGVVQYGNSIDTYLIDANCSLTDLIDVSGDFPPEDFDQANSISLDVMMATG